MNWSCCCSFSANDASSWAKKTTKTPWSSVHVVQECQWEPQGFNPPKQKDMEWRGQTHCLLSLLHRTKEGPFVFLPGKRKWHAEHERRQQIWRLLFKRKQPKSSKRIKLPILQNSSPQLLQTRQQAHCTRCLLRPFWTAQSLKYCSHNEVEL